jgi:hypothetical protein
VGFLADAGAQAPSQDDGFHKVHSGNLVMKLSICPVGQETAS